MNEDDNDAACPSASVVTKERQEGKEVAMGDPASKAILIADDSSTMRRILKNTLLRCGYSNVTEAGDGEEALAKCKAAQFDCILTDWNMPKMDGLEFVMKIKQEPNYAKIPVIMVTTEGCKQDVVEALTHGVTSYIVKPFTEEIIQKRMAECFPA
jgi:two-component system chemotaxis response regulator CheY